MGDFCTVRTVLPVDVQKKYFIRQLDAISAFLDGNLNEEVFVPPLQGTKITIVYNEGLELSKAICSLKQSRRVWFISRSVLMKTLNFSSI